MKFTALSLKTLCIAMLIRNCRYMNFTILPYELAEEIMEAIREPHYGKQKVAIRRLIRPVHNFTSYHDHITDYLVRNDPQNPILRYYIKGTEEYNSYQRARGYGPKPEGLIYNSDRDVFIRADYRHTIDDQSPCYLEEDLPPPLILQLKDIISDPIMIPISTIKPSGVT